MDCSAQMVIWKETEYFINEDEQSEDDDESDNDDDDEDDYSDYE